MRWLHVLTFVVLTLTTTAASAKVCSQSDGMKAEDAVDSLHTWAEIHAAFARYAPQCDDGGVAEGFSDRIVHLLASNWGALPVLYELARTDPGFGRFVLRHIDSTVNTDELRAITKHAESQCPSGYKRLCGETDDAAMAALAEAARAENDP
jgi:hypothetical protein